MPPFKTNSAHRGTAVVFTLAALLFLAFALFTDHRWEDFYITFRASRNLAAGHGLVYQLGDRLQTFTSPLGVLLPALASLATGGQNDEAALWLFRLMSIAALAGAVTLMWKTGLAWGWSRLTCLVLAAWLATDAKSVDFSINGMETGFLLFFLALALHAYGREKGGLQLGLAWAGLMWSRPDAFIYIGGTALGFWLFSSGQSLAADRRQLARIYVRSGLVCTGLYGPWFAWAWWYYGSPVPNTIRAKATALSPHGHGALHWLREIIGFIPHTLRTGPLDGIFSPVYYNFGGWPLWVLHVSRLLAWMALVAFLVPKIRAEVRALSVAAFIGLFYVAHILPFPWYKPAATWLAIVTVCGLAEQAYRKSEVRSTKLLWSAAATGVVLFSAGLLVATARQMRLQQQLIEGQRRSIGLWLRANRANDLDSVMLEPLGYIGYFSQLKMFDVAGLVSREVVAIRQNPNADWGDLIRQLRPVWLVGRPGEPQESVAGLAWFHRHYHLVKTFDQTQRVAALGALPGRAYLEVDQCFHIYHLDETSIVSPP